MAEDRLWVGDYDGTTLTWALWRNGQSVSLEVSQAIRDAGSLTEAVALAKNAGLDVEGLGDWEIIRPLLEQEVQMSNRNEIADQFVDAALRPTGAATMDELRPGTFERHDRAVGEPIEVVRTNEEIQERIREAGFEAIDATAEGSPGVYGDAGAYTAGWSQEDIAARQQMVESNTYNPFPWMVADDYERGAMSLIESGILQKTGEVFPQEELDYWQDQYTYKGGYANGEELLTWSQLPAEDRQRISNKMEDVGLIQEGMGANGAFTPANITGFRQIMDWATYKGVGYEVALQDFATQAASLRRNPVPSSGPRGGRRASFSVPASLRQIPDYESIEQEVTNLFRSRLGRDVEEWELAVLADQMQSKYRDRNSEMIKAARAAFDQAQSGVSGTMEVEVPDPQMRSQKFIEERYGTELDRQDQIIDTSATNRLMVDAMTQGARMVR